MAILAIDCENGCYQLVFFSGCLKFQKVASLLYVKDSVSQRVCCRGRSVSSCRASPAAYLYTLAYLLVTHVRLHCCRISLNCWNNFSVTMRFSRTTGKYCCSIKYLVFLNLVLFYVSSLFDVRGSKPSKIKISQ